MKMKLILSACLAAAATLAPVAASAQHHDRVVTRTVVRHSERHHGWNRHHTRRVCNWKWRGHHKVRVCRTVRW